MSPDSSRFTVVSSKRGTHRFPCAASRMWLFRAGKRPVLRFRPDAPSTEASRPDRRTTARTHLARYASARLHAQGSPLRHHGGRCRRDRGHAAVHGSGDCLQGAAPAWALHRYRRRNRRGSSGRVPRPGNRTHRGLRRDPRSDRIALWPGRPPACNAPGRIDARADGCRQ
jgi:hypothetical protein